MHRNLEADSKNLLENTKDLGWSKQFQKVAGPAPLDFQTSYEAAGLKVNGAAAGTDTWMHWTTQTVN